MKKHTKKVTKDWYNEISQKILALIEEGNAPWHCPFIAGQMSMQSGKPYKGINALMLSVTASANGYTSPWWVTYHKAQELGGHVKKGENGTPVFHWINIKNQKEVEKNGEIEVEEKVFRRLAYAGTVFNIVQCEGIDEPEKLDAEPIANIESIFEEMPNPPTFAHHAGGAMYIPSQDAVKMPTIENHHSLEDYYSVKFHEYVHATGHASRLARKEVIMVNAFGSHDYSVEELVAEFGAAFLCSRAGIEKQETLSNSVAYLQGWAKRIQKDKKLIVTAIQRAQKAVNFILNEQNDAEE